MKYKKFSKSPSPDYAEKLRPAGPAFQATLSREAEEGKTLKLLFNHLKMRFKVE